MGFTFHKCKRKLVLNPLLLPKSIQLHDYRDGLAMRYCIAGSGVTRVKGQPGQLTNKRGRHMGKDELTPPRCLKENSYIWQCIDTNTTSKMQFQLILIQCIHLAHARRNCNAGASFEGAASKEKEKKKKRNTKKKKEINYRNIESYTEGNQYESRQITTYKLQFFSNFSIVW